MARHDSSRISPTAHYTGYVWFRNGLSHPALESETGKLLYRAVQPIMMFSRAFGGPILEDTLLARHQCLEHLLNRAIDSGRIGQVVEIAAGLSPRGFRTMRRFRGRKLVYVEGDLPAMAAHKRARLSAMSAQVPGHHVVDLDALADSGKGSLDSVCERLLDPAVGTAIITEGLSSYFDRSVATGLWRRIAGVLQRFPTGVYLSDVYVDEDLDPITGIRAFKRALGMFTRGGVHIHFARADEIDDEFLRAGFAQVAHHRMADLAVPVALTAGQMYAPVRVLEAMV